MKIIPVKTEVIKPPKSDIFKAIKKSAIKLKEKDVVIVTSKIVAIHEGRCIPVDQIEKEDLVKQESDVYVNDADSRWRICLKHGTFLAGAGIDESNAKDHYILLPKNPSESAKEIHDFLTREYKIKKIGVIISDSHSMPLRYGTLGVALGWYGLDPVTYFTGQPDIFGRPAKYTRINVVDSLAVAGVFCMGELSEQTPVCIIRNAPHLNFVNHDTSRDLFIPPREDIYWPLLKGLYKK